MKLFILLCLLVAGAAQSAPMPDADAQKLATAIYHAEGGAKTRHPYGILSVKCSGPDEARRVCLNTIKNNFVRWQAAGSKGEYLVFLANKYAPTKNATNDPTGLNNNWLKNVRSRLAKG